MNRIGFDSPASSWEEALPIGNGRLGGMVFGGIGADRVQLNEDSFWHGGFRDRVNPDARSHLAAIREGILAGRIPETQERMKAALSGVPDSQHPYQTAGDLRIDWKMSEPVRRYRRELDLDNGFVRVEMETEQSSQIRTYYASNPDQVIVLHAVSSANDLSLTLSLERSRFFEHTGRLAQDTLYMDGDLGRTGSLFLVAVKAVATGGTVELTGGHLSVRDAREVVLYLAAETSFYHGDRYRDVVRERLDRVSGMPAAEVLRRHVDDFGERTGRVRLRLGNSREIRAERLLKAARSEPNARSDAARRRLAELYFQYGRYLLLSSSRPGSQPANLQGIWNDRMQPSWDSKYTININTEMNYWPAEVCALPECHLPLFDLLGRMREKGTAVADAMYGCRGFVAHHNTDLWGDCAPQDVYIPATYWVLGGAWLCTHVWTHYQYTGDEAFLRSMYPVLRDAVWFFVDFLMRDGEEVVICPSVSPENTYILPNGVRGSVCANAAMDTQILRDLLRQFLRASSVLGETGSPVGEAEDILGRLPPIRVGRHGQIMEWREDYEEAEPGHRHISQLYALHPSHQITLDKTPALAAAAERTLERRLSHGGGHTGWSRAWIVNLYTRLGRGNKAWENLLALWSRSTYPNFMDNHPLSHGTSVFQIDGNLGATAAMAEMLVQADGERILLLPALPAAWRRGSIEGLRIPGNAAIDVAWRAGRLERCVLRSKSGFATSLCYAGVTLPVELSPGESGAWRACDFSSGR